VLYLGIYGFDLEIGSTKILISSRKYAKNKFATQGRFNKMKAKKHKKVTPYPSEMSKYLKLATPPQNFQLFVEIFLKEICLLSL